MTDDTCSIESRHTDVHLRDDRYPDAKPWKIPHVPWEYEHPERFVGHDDPEVWTDFDTAREWVEKLPGYGLANRVSNAEADERRVAFLDFDDVCNTETGEIHPKAWDIIQTHDLPAWLSTSGTGLQAFAVVEETLGDYKQNTEIKLPEWDHTDEPALELFTNMHFCALMGEHVEGTPLDALALTETVGGTLRERGEKKQPDGDAFDPDAKAEPNARYHPLDGIDREILDPHTQQPQGVIADE